MLLPTNTRDIIVPSNTCNDNVSYWVSVNQFTKLVFLRIGDNCMKNVEQLVITNVPTLKWVEIGINSFTYVGGEIPSSKNTNRKFILKGCAVVASLNIKSGSFSDFGTCQIENVPALKTISIGSMDASFASNNFYYANIELQSSGCEGG